MRLFANGEQVGIERVELEAGTTDVTFRVTPAEAGFLRFRVVVEAALNTFSQNDRADANTIVQGEPRTLVVSGDEAVAAELIGALETERQTVDSIAAEGLSSDPLVLAAYDSIVLVDVPRTTLTDRQMLALQVYVRDLGKGLVMVGGPNAYGAGGYEKTPIEETLPVDMGVRNREQQPDIALVVVIDKSGSMDACHCNTFDGGSGRRIRDGWRPQGRHRQGGDPAGGRGDDRARRVRRGRVRRVGPLGRPDPAARQRRRPAGRGRRDPAARPDEHLRRPQRGRRSRSRAPRPRGATSSC